MKHLHYYVCTILLLISYCSSAQQEAILSAPPEKRLLLLWQYCKQTYISDQDSLVAHRFFNSIKRGADSLGDRQLQAYAEYFQQGWRIHFSASHFPQGYAQAVHSLEATRLWALKNGHPDIAVACSFTIGLVYSSTEHYGLAFEYLLKAHAAFEKLDYENIPNASDYLYQLGLQFYRFEEYDKALQQFLQATRYHFFLPRTELNTLNAIGLIYARNRESAKAVLFFKNTIAKAKQYNDSAWVGIAAGNVGNVFLAAGQLDSALFYHRINYGINTISATSAAPEDGAKTALSIAAVYVQKSRLDSALFYAKAGEQLAARFIKDTTESLDFRKRLLKILIDHRKTGGNLGAALLLTDSLFVVEQALRNRLDGKILSRAVEKTKAASYSGSLTLLQSQKDLAQLRFYFIIATLVILLLLVGVFFRDKWLREKRQMQLAAKDKQILLAEKARAEEGLNHSKELLHAYIETIKEKTQLIGHLETELTDLKKFASQVPELETLTLNREKLMASTILTDKDWQQFRVLFEQVHPGFSHRLKTSYPDLSPAEARFIFLTKLNLSSREMATMLGISVESMYKLRYRLRKKLNLEEGSSFEAVLHMIDEPVKGKVV